MKFLKQWLVQVTDYIIDSHIYMHVSASDSMQEAVTRPARILVQVTIYRRLLIGRDGHIDQSEAYDISKLVREYGHRT